MTVCGEGEFMGRGQSLLLKETHLQLSQGPARLGRCREGRWGGASIYLIISRTRNGRVPLQDSLSKSCHLSVVHLGHLSVCLASQGNHS